MKLDESSQTELHSDLSRRSVIKAALLAAAVPASLFVANAQGAAPLVPLKVDDPQAKALGYVIDSTKVDLKANPAHKPEQKCATCVQFQGKPGDQQAGCNLFPGKSVVAGGWCKVWTLKPGAK